MTDLHIGLMGIIAGTCTTVSLIPQIIKIVKTKQVRDISLYMFVILSTGIFLWFIYGILIDEFPIILANGMSFVLSSYVIGAKIIYGRKGRGR